MEMKLKINLQTLIPLFVITLLVEFSSAVSCPVDFQDRCVCGKTSYVGRQRFVVNCTNSQFEDAAMLEKLPPQTEVVIFTGNTESECKCRIQ